MLNESRLLFEGCLRKIINREIGKCFYLPGTHCILYVYVYYGISIGTWSSRNLDRVRKEPIRYTRETAVGMKSKPI